MVNKVRFAFASTCLLSVLLVGCTGYQLGNQNLFRPDIRTVHVPIVQSESFRRGLGERLTESMVKEIELRTPYKVVDASQADSIFQARIVDEHKRVIAENQFDEARDIEAQRDQSRLLLLESIQNLKMPINLFLRLLFMEV